MFIMFYRRKERKQCLDAVTAGSRLSLLLPLAPLSENAEYQLFFFKAQHRIRGCVWMENEQGRVLEITVARDKTISGNQPAEPPKRESGAQPAPAGRHRRPGGNLFTFSTQPWPHTMGFMTLEEKRHRSVNPEGKENKPP